jgi:ribonuclease P protein component
VVGSCWLAVAPRAASASLSDALPSLTSRRNVTSPAPSIRSCRLTPAQRLKQKREFDLVYKQARRSSDSFFTVLARDNPGHPARLGLSMPAKVVGNAVRRNLVKRLVRESFRMHQHGLPAADIVVNARSGVRTGANSAILRSLERHWQSVIVACARS